MYFKRIELHGFKSFAEKTRLDFEPGITAIVGPNGCGKSNISDSIKWVLGEQSAKTLRGSKMQDVIFNGTDVKEPVNFAEVSLTLDNKDRNLPIEYDEVTVSRRLYRSGESEYLINKTPVRLKDINEIFMGTGIGTSAYSLIEQGRIDQILSSRPEERREVFEEASGITKFKVKKKEALRRLEDTEQNLLRINDIVTEVKRQINSIERQAKKAERYKEKYEELKVLELKLMRINLERLKENLTSSTTDIDGLKKRENEIEKELNSVRDELSDLTTKRSDLESKRMEYKSDIMNMESEISTSRDKITMNSERIEELKKKKVELEDEIDKNKGNLSSQGKEVKTLREKVGVLESENLERAATLSEKESRLSNISKTISENETIISTSKANIIDLESKESRLRNQNTKVTSSLATHEARSKRLIIEKETIGEEKKSLDARLEEVLREQRGLEEEVSSIRSQKEECSKNIDETTLAIASVVDNLQQLNRTLAVDMSKLEALEEAKAKYEGFSSGVKALLGSESKTQHGIEGIKDVLANLLSVENGYEVAIESSLGNYLQSIVVDEKIAAEKAIDYLKDNSSGRASFIHPPSFSDPGELGQDIDISDSRILGKAVDFIRIDEHYSLIVKNLLKNIFIVKNLIEARGILNERASSGNIRLVTLLGEMVSNGFISGGDVSQEGFTLVNRDARIKELHISIEEAEKRSKGLEEEKLDRESRKIKLEEEIKGLASVLGGKEILLANVSTRREHLEENIKTVSDEIALVNLELDEVTQELTRLKGEEGTLKNSLDEAENEARLNQARIRESEVLLNEYAKEKEQLLIETAEQKTELGSLESKKEGLSSTLQILESSLRDLEFSLETRNNEIKNSIIKVDELTRDISILENRVSELSTKKIDSDNALFEIENVYRELISNIERINKSYKILEEELNGLRSNFHNADLKKVETSYSIDNLCQRMKDVYKVDLKETELGEGWQDVELDPLKNEVDEKREKLDLMGTVNLVAIEEHTELQDRFQFLTNQRDDLLKAKDSLLKAIDKINKTTKELFIETFRSIQVEFRNFFKMMFGGGEGELILLDEGNVLESGIEIVARPPGKRLQNVSLLSGGERALTAISLIFAIFKVKPSPFCVLDEIDAPLDESNVDRFSRSLDMFTNTSQFIVITHNKKTIDRADVMYGITMQQSGISKVVSVKFHEAKKEKPADVPA
ncbi:MAG: chromosome segregation protein SMC [Candidatus Omnitrophota bacterium]